MKYILLLIISVAILFTACNSTQNIGINKWAPEKIKVDGKLDEWAKPLQKPVLYTDIECDVANDQNNLYVCARITDKNLQQRIMTLGMTIWVDTLMKNREKIGVGYPLALTEEQIEKISFAAQRNNKLDPHALDDAYAAICQEFELVGFVEERVRVSNLASRDMKVATSFDEVGAMICELNIPLTQIWDRALLYNEKMSLGIKINNPPTDAAEDDAGLFDNTGRNTITGNNQNGMGGLPGQTGQPGQQPNARQQMSRSSSNNIAIWLRTTLTKGD